MGVVYRAVEEGLERPVALKLIAPAYGSDPGFRERFKRESRVAAAIDHPNVIPIFRAGEQDGQLFLAMRWVDGVDLETLIARHGRLEPKRAVRLIAQIGEALQAAHERGLVHRDVKPANALVTASDHVYLTDFGLTKRTDSKTGLTRSGHFLGTVDYSSPEQLQAEQLDPRADVYSLGCTLYKALSGHVPFERTTDTAKMLAHIQDPPPTLEPHTPSPLNQVVQRALAKNKHDRWPTTRALANAAQQTLGQKPPARRRRIQLTAGALGLAGAVSVLAVVLAGGLSSPTSVGSLEEQAARRVVERFAGASGADRCDLLVGTALNAFGGRRGCQRELSGSRATYAEVEILSASRGRAVAQATAPDGQRFRFSLRHTHRGWRIEDVKPQRRAD
jgi:hypothetical protein